MLASLRLPQTRFRHKIQPIYLAPAASTCIPHMHSPIQAFCAGRVLANTTRCLPRCQLRSLPWLGTAQALHARHFSTSLGRMHLSLSFSPPALIHRIHAMPSLWEPSLAPVPIPCLSSWGTRPGQIADNLNHDRSICPARLRNQHRAGSCSVWSRVVGQGGGRVAVDSRRGCICCTPRLLSPAHLSQTCLPWSQRKLDS